MSTVLNRPVMKEEEPMLNKKDLMDYAPLERIGLIQLCMNEIVTTIENNLKNDGYTSESVDSSLYQLKSRLKDLETTAKSLFKLNLIYEELDDDLKRLDILAKAGSYFGQFVKGCKFEITGEEMYYYMDTVWTSICHITDEADKIKELISKD